MDKTKKFAYDIRKTLLDEIAHKGGGHIGGSLSIVDVLAVLYGEVMNIRPDKPDWEKRDYLVCSKGHAGPAVYATLALKGFMPISELDYLNKGGSKLPGHCDRNKVPGIDATTGSLGQGLSVACGIAIGLIAQGRTAQKVFCIIGDGECDEGQIWEAAQFASHYSLSNLCVFLDWNKRQIDGNTEIVMSNHDLKAKFQAFGWDSCIVDGNNIDDIRGKVMQWKNAPGRAPQMVICDTKKGAGIPCIEEMDDNHCNDPAQYFRFCMP